MDDLHPGVTNRSGSPRCCHQSLIVKRTSDLVSIGNRISILSVQRIAVVRGFDDLVTGRRSGKPTAIAVIAVLIVIHRHDAFSNTPFVVMNAIP